MKKILVIEDSYPILNIIETVLTRSGYRVAVAHDGNEGIELLKKHSDFNIVITDIRMPGATGNDVAEHIRENDVLRETPVIAITAYLNDARDELFDYLFSKPFNMKDLIKVIDSFFKMDLLPQKDQLKT